MEMDLNHSCQNIKKDYDNDNNVKFKEIRKYLRENYNWTMPNNNAASVVLEVSYDEHVPAK